MERTNKLKQRGLGMLIIAGLTYTTQEKDNISLKTLKHVYKLNTTLWW